MVAAVAVVPRELVAVVLRLELVVRVVTEEPAAPGTRAAAVVLLEPVAEAAWAVTEEMAAVVVLLEPVALAAWVVTEEMAAVVERAVSVVLLEPVAEAASVEAEAAWATCSPAPSRVFEMRLLKEEVLTGSPAAVRPPW